MPRAQPGVFSQGTREHYHLEFDLHDGAGPDTAALALARLVTTAMARPNLNVVVGVAPELWRALAPGAGPQKVEPFPEIPGVPMTQHHIWIWFHGAAPDLAFDAARAAAGSVEGIATLSEETRAFEYRNGRDLTGFIDGSANPPVELAGGVALIPDGMPGAGGSFAITQRWVHDLQSFHGLSVREQEDVIGRTKSDSIELEASRKPPTAHIARVVIEDDGEELEIYRRSAPYGNVKEAGLFFVAFSADPTRFTRMLWRMFGVSGDGLRDRLTDFSRPVTGSYYFVPGLEALEGVVSS